MSVLGDGAPLKKRSASEVAAERIRKAILDGVLVPGQRLREEELARDLEISRTPVREALRVLTSEGFVKWTPYQGSTVQTYTAADLDDLYQLRAILEGHAARRAATRITDETTHELWASCDRFEQIGEPGPATIHELVEENLCFHRHVHHAAGSERLTEMITKVVAIPLVVKSYVWYSPNQKRISEHAHRQLAASLNARDADRAEMIMQEHVYEARDHLVNYLLSTAPVEDRPANLTEASA